jgi:hypothetical protein
MSHLLSTLAVLFQGRGCDYFERRYDLGQEAPRGWEAGLAFFVNTSSCSRCSIFVVVRWGRRGWEGGRRSGREKKTARPVARDFFGWSAPRTPPASPPNASPSSDQPDRARGVHLVASSDAASAQSLISRVRRCRRGGGDARTRSLSASTTVTLCPGPAPPPPRSTTSPCAWLRGGGRGCLWRGG